MHQARAPTIRVPAAGGSAPVPPRQVIVAVEPPLLRDMLSRLVRQIEGLQLRAELAGPSGLASMLEQEGSHCVILSLGREGQMPEFVQWLTARHPEISVLGVAEDGSEVQVESAGNPVKYLAHPSLTLLIAVMLESGHQDSPGEAAT